MAAAVSSLRRQSVACSDSESICGVLYERGQGARSVDGQYTEECGFCVKSDETRCCDLLSMNLDIEDS